MLNKIIQVIHAHKKYFYLLHAMAKKSYFLRLHVTTVPEFYEIQSIKTTPNIHFRTLTPLIQVYVLRALLLLKWMPFFPSCNHGDWCSQRFLCRFGVPAADSVRPATVGLYATVALPTGLFWSIPHPTQQCTAVTFRDCTSCFAVAASPRNLETLNELIF